MLSILAHRRVSRGLPLSWGAELGNDAQVWLGGSPTRRTGQRKWSKSQEDSQGSAIYDWLLNARAFPAHSIAAAFTLVCSVP